MHLSSRTSSSKKAVLLGTTCAVLLGIAGVGGYKMAGGSGRVAAPVGASETRLQSEAPLPRASGGERTALAAPMGAAPTTTIHPGTGKVESVEISAEQRKSVVDLLTYPGVESVPSPSLPPKEGFHQEVIVGWTSDAVETVIAHYQQKLAESGFKVEIRGTAGESVGTVMAEKPDGTGSVEVSVGREEGGKTHVIVHFNAPK